jgi:homoserine kinase
VINVTVPASSANLGPGFDAFGLALTLYDRVGIESRSSGFRVQVSGEGADGRLPSDEHHLVVRSVLATLAELGSSVDGLQLHCHNAIPHARGLGSSAAAVVAGIAAGYALAGVELTGTERRGRALQLAAAFEGHADNAAASLLGGLVVVWSDDGVFHARRLQPHADLVPVLLVPSTESSTATTRGLLPATVPHQDAAFNVGRAALAVHALTAAPELLLTATADRLHQPYRACAYPASADVVASLRAAGVPAMVSGAGPAVLALTTGEPPPAEVDLRGFRMLRLGVDAGGVRIERAAG